MCKITLELQLEEKKQLEQKKLAFNADMVGNVGIPCGIMHTIAGAWIKKTMEVASTIKLD